MRRRTALHTSALAVISAVALACSAPGPQPLRVGEDACDVCRMAITDTRFGGEVLMTTRRHRTFDSIECLVSFLGTSPDTSRVGGVYVSDYERQTLIDAATAVYLQGGSVKSPMGRSLAAFAAGSDTTALRSQFGGTVMDWSGVRAAETGHTH